MEKIVHNRLTNLLETHNILTPNQDGFRKGRSTMDTIVGSTDDIALDINKGNCTVAAFIDFKKAFDMTFYFRNYPDLALEETYLA